MQTPLILLLMAAAAPQLNPGNPSTIEDFRAGDAHREDYQRATEVVRAMEVAPGDWTADLGAGAGYYSMRLSELAGPNGKVFAVDVSDASMRWLRRRVELFGLRNVEVVLGDARDPKLPADSLSSALVVNSWHHFVEYPQMARQILHALRPGARLVLADYSLPEHRIQSRAEQVKIHEIDPALVRSELSDAGLQIVRTEDPFLKRKPEAAPFEIARADLYLIVAVRPK